MFCYLLGIPLDALNDSFFCVSRVSLFNLAKETLSSPTRYTLPPCPPKPTNKNDQLRICIKKKLNT